MTNIEKGGSESLWTKLQNIKIEYIWVLFFILMIIPIAFPLISKYKINESTINVYKYVEDLPEGSIIISGGAGNYAFMYETSAAFISFLTQIKDRNMKLIIFPLHPDSLMFEPWAISVAGFDKENEYGKDWVVLNYVPGGAAITLPAFCKDIRKFVATDLYGTPIDDLPIFANVNSAEDFDLWVDCGANSMWSLVRYVSPLKVPIIGFVHSDYYPMFQPFVAAGQVVALTNGIRGGAEYEMLVGKTAWNLGTITMDSYQLTSIYVLVLVILMNVGTQMVRMEKKEEIVYD